MNKAKVYSMIDFRKRNVLLTDELIDFIADDYQKESEETRETYTFYQYFEKRMSSC
ncbi:hypothetical protein IMZ31_21650 (plasmid) [Pontibacillus sp. ALD_SL1]|uniref:hypothetical protein n=1 Tax=Pontibacillus sp. ALD_SL1 TaxID=2777185 RepID=UPI001A96D101|nr:hypothetical protein [Pontibacillus sp. ALD_SL1]QST02058.1 hypothetical protein IMZ31_21650 [Pontibacillus sp. ALD_SL1]